MIDRLSGHSRCLVSKSWMNDSRCPPSQGRSLSCLETGTKCLCSSQLNHCIFLHDLNLENEHSLLWCSSWDRKSLCWDRDSGAWDLAFDSVKILEGRNYKELRCESEPRGGKMEKHRWLSQKMSFHKRQKLFFTYKVWDPVFSLVGQYAQINLY